MKKPSVAVVWIQLVSRPRRPSGACSATYVAAPPYSPPSARPCNRRRLTSRIGASQPIVSNVGRKPTAAVRHAHHEDGDEERVLAADQVADAPEHQRAERPHEEARGVGGESGEQRGGLVALREEQGREERRERRVEIEVVPLEDGSERRGEDDFLLLARFFRGSFAGRTARRQSKYIRRRRHLHSSMRESIGSDVRRNRTIASQNMRQGLCLAEKCAGP